MSAADVELVRSIYGAWAGGESAAPFIDRDVEYVNPPDAVEAGTLRGRRSFARIRDVYDEVSIEPERYIDVGNGDVIVIAAIHVKAPASGMETTSNPESRCGDHRSGLSQAASPQPPRRMA